MNLQQARHVINFDLPWNPMRLVQRHGRIDRIGSSHDKVFMHCFFPDADLDELLGLEERLMRKIKQAAAAVGVESEPLPGSKAQDVVFSQTRDEIEALAREEAVLFESGGEVSAYSGEEYRQELRAAMESPSFAEKVRSLPWGSGSGMARSGSQLSYVFCARVGDYGAPLFRYVAPDIVDPETETAPLVVDDTLTALAAANCSEDEVRVLMRRPIDVPMKQGISRVRTSWRIGSAPRIQPTCSRAFPRRFGRQPASSAITHRPGWPLTRLIRLSVRLKRRTEIGFRR